MESGHLGLLSEGMSPEEKRACRVELLAAFGALKIPVDIRAPDAFQAHDDSVLYAESEIKEAMVCIAEKVSWGPELSTYVKPIDEPWTRPLLMIEVPNQLDGRVPEITECLRRWFVE